MWDWEKWPGVDSKGPRHVIMGGGTLECMSTRGRLHFRARASGAAWSQDKSLVTRPIPLWNFVGGVGLPRPPRRKARTRLRSAGVKAELHLWNTDPSTDAAGNNSNSTQSMNDPLTESQLQRLEAGLQARIEQLQYLKTQLPLVDQEVFCAGMDLFESETLLALWLAQPAVALGGEVPLRLMGAPEARQLIANTLRRIEHGVY